MDAFNAQELLVMLGQHAQQVASYNPIFTGVIKSYDPKLGVVITIQPEVISIGPMPLLTPWGGPGWGEQGGPSVGQSVTVLVMNGPEQSSFLCLGTNYSNADKPPTFSYNGNTVVGAAQGEWLVVHAKTGTYMWAANDSILHLGGQEQVEILSPLTTIGDLKANLNSTDNPVVRMKDLQAVLTNINNFLSNIFNLHTHPTGTGPSGVPIQTQSNLADATGSSAVWAK